MSDSSSNSSSNSSSTGTTPSTPDVSSDESPAPAVEEAPAPAPEAPAAEEAPEDPTPLADQVDGGMRGAQAGDQRSVYLWTLSHTNKPGRTKPADLTRQGFADAVAESYVKSGKTWEQWISVKETHPLSKSKFEQELHCHLVIATTGKGRWLEQAAYLREHKAIFASVATASSKNSYWAGVAYLLCPSAKKPKEDLDQEPLMSPGHDPLPAWVQMKSEGTRRLAPSETVDGKKYAHDVESTWRPPL